MKRSTLQIIQVRRPTTVKKVRKTRGRGTQSTEAVPSDIRHWRGDSSILTIEVGWGDEMRRGHRGWGGCYPNPDRVETEWGRAIAWDALMIIMIMDQEWQRASIYYVCCCAPRTQSASSKIADNVPNLNILKTLQDSFDKWSTGNAMKAVHSGHSDRRW